MTSTLPTRPDIAQLRRQAKELQRSARDGHAAAIGRLARVAPDPQRANLAAAQLAVAREYGYSSWPALRAAVADATPATGMHVARSIFADKDLSEPSLFTADRFLAVAHDAGWQPGPLPDAVIFTFSGIFAHVLRDDGVSAHYLPPDTYVDAHPGLSASLLESLGTHGVSATYGSTWTVPTPYRSTATEVRQLADDGVAVVECEVASLLAVAEALGVRAAACLYVTGSLTDPSQAPPHEPLRPLEVFEATLAALCDTP